MLELNISCPNVKEGGMAYGVRAEAAGEVVRLSRGLHNAPDVELSPGREHPRYVQGCGSCRCGCHQSEPTPSRPAPLIWKSATRCSTTSLPVCPARRSAPLHCAWCGRLWGRSNIPVMGLGGIATGRDALEFIMAGATAVQVGAANFWTRNPAPSPLLPRLGNGWTPTA